MQISCFYVSAAVFLAANYQSSPVPGLNGIGEVPLVGANVPVASGFLDGLGLNSLTSELTSTLGRLFKRRDSDGHVASGSPENSTNPSQSRPGGPATASLGNLGNVSKGPLTSGGSTQESGVPALSALPLPSIGSAAGSMSNGVGIPSVGSLPSLPSVGSATKSLNGAGIPSIGSLPSLPSVVSATKSLNGAGISSIGSLPSVPSVGSAAGSLSNGGGIASIGCLPSLSSIGSETGSLSNGGGIPSVGSLSLPSVGSTTKPSANGASYNGGSNNGVGIGSLPSVPSVGSITHSLNNSAGIPSIGSLPSVPSVGSATGSLNYLTGGISPGSASVGSPSGSYGTGAGAHSAPGTSADIGSTPKQPSRPAPAAGSAVQTGAQDGYSKST